jgi:hypothetical protein
MYVIPATACAKQLILVPAAPPRTFLASDVTAAQNGVAALTQKHPSWPSSRVRATVARNLNISTVQLRYLLRQAAK